MFTASVGPMRMFNLKRGFAVLTMVAMLHLAAPRRVSAAAMTACMMDEEAPCWLSLGAMVIATAVVLELEYSCYIALVDGIPLDEAIPCLMMAAAMMTLIAAEVAYFNCCDDNPESPNCIGEN